ncbi:Amidohydro-rel domain-containing protein [Mycena indigotica]|uniref:Amidohydro-rel domain-containing protein n=1 Tax=Mycena indigotica TaxID=2126181 RepID=A0A8H6S6E0_9AGAR|nr:Amidohydro-rel domain-containing protein [Mycena indigotica]KAF7293055.1 Amidohydro-rel domain-containing protein [Mycena indigotica]
MRKHFQIWQVLYPIGTACFFPLPTMQLSLTPPIETRPSLLPKLAAKPWVRAPAEELILVNTRIVRPESSSVLGGLQDIHIKKGFVAAIKPSKAEPSPTREGDQVKIVDLQGAYVCPGLIDCHVHVTAVPGSQNMMDIFSASEQDVNLRTTYVLKEMLLRGFTTVRDTGGASKRIALAIEEGLIPGPRLIQCGKGLSQTGGHGDFTPSESHTGCCGGHGAAKGLGRVVDGVPDILKATREELKAGADFIKIMVGGGVASETDTIESVQFTAEEIQAVTTTCKQMGGKMVTAHAYTVDSVRHAIDNGATGIEHGNLIDRPTANLMASKGVYLTPTLSCYGIMIRPPFEDFLPPSGKIKNEQVQSQGLDAMKIAHEAGVTICYGSDLLSSMHALQTEEFSVRAGVLPSDVVLKHATTNPAKMLGKSSLIGTIAPGAYADLLVLDANPLEDVTILDWPENHLLAVMKGGRVYRSSIADLSVDGL